MLEAVFKLRFVVSLSVRYEPTNASITSRKNRLK
jgi:hypothetical protein